MYFRSDEENIKIPGSVADLRPKAAVSTPHKEPSEC